MDYHYAELYHLNLSDVLLPPYGFLEFRIDSGKEIVAVHDAMHKAINNSK